MTGCDDKKSNSSLAELHLEDGSSIKYFTHFEQSLIRHGFNNQSTGW
jgi:hypothetical protein